MTLNLPRELNRLTGRVANYAAIARLLLAILVFATFFTRSSNLDMHLRPQLLPSKPIAPIFLGLCPSRSPFNSCLLLRMRERPVWLQADS